MRNNPSPWKNIHRWIQKLVNGNVGASDLQQAQPLALRTLAKERRIALLQEEQGMCKHILDEASGQLLNHNVYISEQKKLSFSERQFFLWLGLYERQIPSYAA